MKKCNTYCTLTWINVSFLSNLKKPTLNSCFIIKNIPHPLSQIHGNIDIHGVFYISSNIFTKTHQWRILNSHDDISLGIEKREMYTSSEWNACNPLNSEDAIKNLTNFLFFVMWTKALYVQWKTSMWDIFWHKNGKSPLVL